MAKIGLILGGGGARGSYQIGVLKALLEENLLKNLFLVAGTSIGAMNSCLVMEKLNYEEMYDFWTAINNKNLYRVELSKREGAEFLGIFDQRSMYEVLVEKQDKEVIKNSDIKGYVAVTKVNGYKPKQKIHRSILESELISLNDSEDPHKAVLASASIPVVFVPTEINGEYYLDGGIFNNLPIDAALIEGCDVIIAVGLTNNYDLEKYDVSDKKLLVNFSPIKKISLTVLGMLDFNEKTMDKRIEHGYEEATALIKALKDIGIIKNNDWDEEIKGIYQLNHKYQLIKK